MSDFLTWVRRDAYATWPVPRLLDSIFHDFWCQVALVALFCHERTRHMASDCLFLEVTWCRLDEEHKYAD